MFHSGFNANCWWIDFRPFGECWSEAFLAVVSIFLVAYALYPDCGRRRLRVTTALVTILLGGSAWNVVNFYLLVCRGAIEAGFLVPFSIFVSVALVIVLVGLGGTRGRRGDVASQVFIFIGFTVLVFGFGLAQMYCFGKTDYRRKAEAVVVFGARVYADGRCSDAVADRVRTGCALVGGGFGKTLILSGGPGDGAIHETEAMRAMAVNLGVPDESIVLDKDGLNTGMTVGNTCRIFESRGIERVLVVSHFYHLPRIKMAYQRRGWEVYTVPAKESYVLRELPWYLMREIAALWVYYARPLVV